MKTIDHICKIATTDWLLHYLWCEASSILIYQTEAVILTPAEREEKYLDHLAVIQEIADRLQIPTTHFPPAVTSEPTEPIAQ